MTTEPDETQDDTSGPKALREALDREKARNDELLARANTAEAQLKQKAFSELGLDPNTGIGKAIAKLYDGPADVDAMRAYAETEFGYTAPTTGAAAVVHQAQDRVDAVLQAGAPAPATTMDAINAQIAKAEAEGDWATAMTLKMQKLTG